MGRAAAAPAHRNPTGPWAHTGREGAPPNGCPAAHAGARATLSSQQLAAAPTRGCAPAGAAGALPAERRRAHAMPAGAAAAPATGLGPLRHTMLLLGPAAGPSSLSSPPALSAYLVLSAAAELGRGRACWSRLLRAYSSIDRCLSVVCMVRIVMPRQRAGGGKAGGGTGGVEAASSLSAFLVAPYPVARSRDSRAHVERRPAGRQRGTGPRGPAGRRVVDQPVDPCSLLPWQLPASAAFRNDYNGSCVVRAHGGRVQSVGCTVRGCWLARVLWHGHGGNVSAVLCFVGVVVARCVCGSSSILSSKLQVGAARSRSHKSPRRPVQQRPRGRARVRKRTFQQHRARQGSGARGGACTLLPSGRPSAGARQTTSNQQHVRVKSTPPGSGRAAAGRAAPPLLCSSYC
jgi:hypothetical protein